MKQVMKRAWEIAKEGAKKFGGKVREYFASSLTIAWKEIKAMAEKVEIQISEGSKKHKSWVAEIVGTDVKWGFKRQFINAREDENIKGLFYNLEEGKVYDVNCAQKGRKFVSVKAGEVVELSQNEVKGLFA